MKSRNIKIEGSPVIQRHSEENDDAITAVIKWFASCETLQTTE